MTKQDELILSIDQGTTSSRAIIFNSDGAALHTAQQEFEQLFPDLGWVEHDPEQIWATTLATCKQALKQCASHTVQVIGITNQRETTVVWERATGKPIYNAIVWQDRRTADICQAYKEKGLERVVKEKTGLLLDPYFSGSKIAWILDNVEGARRQAEQGKLACGTIDSFLLWRLTEGKLHATDATNASRTALFNIHTQSWDDELLDLFNVPSAILPEVHDSAADYGSTQVSVLGTAIPICAMIGDQQSAAVGQCCFDAGQVKSTYGTGCFALMNTGEKAVASSHGLLTTVAYRLNDKPAYALEGSIFVAGAAVQWLRDKMQLINKASETQDLAQALDSNDGVYMVPAFVGLGAPHWNPQARGAIFGLTRDTGPAHFARAALESVAYQTHDLIEAMSKDAGASVPAIRIDGGMVGNDWLCQMLADILDLPAQRPSNTETTALGAAYLAGLQAGLYDSLEQISSHYQPERLFSPQMNLEQRELLLNQWQQAVQGVNAMV